MQLTNNLYINLNILHPTHWFKVKNLHINNRFCDQIKVFKNLEDVCFFFFILAIVHLSQKTVTNRWLIYPLKNNGLIIQANIPLHALFLQVILYFFHFIKDMMDEVIMGKISDACHDWNPKPFYL